VFQFDLGNLAMVTGGHNNGRVGTIVHKEKHRGGHDIVHIEDSSGNRWEQGQGLCCLAAPAQRKSLQQNK
jgi:small subunit ribosomal protein S4e